ncbi:hypothetical protein [Corallococcus sp. RDP092CA]|uniref:hypothetical protein n=1 Tax=Corallococcus sp. RDP092CA TaxID=3109369 RepID=UPI0035B229F1
MSSDSRIQPVAVGLMAAVALALGCADFERGPVAVDAGAPPIDGGGDGDGGGAVSFTSDVQPLLTAGCQSCHRSGGAAGSTSFLLTGDADADYAAALSLTDTSNPSASRLLRKASGAGHGGGAVYGEGTPEYQTLLAWISGGAQP